MRTEMGRIAGLLEETREEDTPLQRELDRTGKLLGGVVVAIAVVMIATILLVEDVSGAGAVFEVLILGEALAVAAVPEGLPAVVTAVLAVGVVMAAGTLLVLDASLPGGLVDGRGDLRYGHTMAFTTLMLFQLFNVFNARSDERSAFAGLFANAWLWGAVALAVLLQLLVLYVPALGQAFGTVPLGAGDWLRCLAVASSVLWLREIDKAVTRALDRRRM